MNPSTFGDSVTFTATVTGVAGAEIPTGSVQFSVDGVLAGAPVTVAAGSASLVLSGLDAGDHTITVAYAGSENYETSTAAMTQSVARAETSTVVDADVHPSAYGGRGDVHRDRVTASCGRNGAVHGRRHRSRIARRGRAGRSRGQRRALDTRHRRSRSRRDVLGHRELPRQRRHDHADRAPRRHDDDGDVRREPGDVRRDRDVHGDGRAPTGRRFRATFDRRCARRRVRSCSPRARRRSSAPGSPPAST